MLKFAKFLLTLVVIELILGGSGRLMEVRPELLGFEALPPFTVRMVLYAGMLALSIYMIADQYQLPKYVLPALLVFVFVNALGAIIGLSRGHPLEDVGEDLKPLLAFSVLPFIALAVRDARDVARLSSLIKWTSLFMGVVYLVFLAVYYSGYIAFMEVYALTSPSGDFMWRGDKTFFFKGFLYLCVGAVFFLTDKGWFKWIALSILVTAIVLTLTRGLLLALVAAFLFYGALLSRRQGIIVLVMGVIVGVSVAETYSERVGDKSASDEIRYIQIEEVRERVTIPSMIWGHGFGRGVPIRPIHMEISLLEVFHKQGIIGIAFWIGILGFIGISFMNARRAGYLREAAPFLLSCIIIYVQSFTNPYMNNPIGLTMIMISMVCLRVLGNGGITRLRRFRIREAEPVAA